MVAQQVVQDLQLQIVLVTQRRNLINCHGQKVVIKQFFLSDAWLILFFVGGCCRDYSWCDVMPIISVCHLLLGRPWQFDHGIIQNGRENSYTIQGNVICL